jgi:hypothetical protein
MADRAVARSAAMVRLGGWCALLGLVIAVLAAAGLGPLALPVAGESWASWLHARDAITVTFVAIRVAALVLAWYLLLIGLVGGAATVARSARLLRLADWLAVPAVRALAQSVLGVTFATVTLAVVSPRAAGPGLDVSATATAAIPAPPPLPAPPTAAPSPPPPPAAPRIIQLPHQRDQQAPPTWTVQAGDHFWSIAQRHLDTVLGESPPQERVDRYWRRLVDANRDRLRDPTNIDLIYPGQVLQLPPVEHHTVRR